MHTKTPGLIGHSDACTFLERVTSIREVICTPHPPSHERGKFHLYTCKCALHSFTVYVSFPLLSLGVKKKRFWIHLMSVI